LIIGALGRLGQMDKLVMHNLGAADPSPQHPFVDHGPQGRRPGLVEDSLPVEPRRDQLIDLVLGFGGLPRLEQGPGVLGCLEQAGMSSGSHQRITVARPSASIQSANRRG
jgi:hypothetical protein